MHQMLSVHTTAEKFENATITGHFGFVCAETSGREIDAIVFNRIHFQNVFRPPEKKSLRFQIQLV